MPATYEELLAYLLAHLAEPVEQHTDEDGAVVITSGDPVEVIVRLTELHVTIAEPAVVWHARDEPVVVPIEIGTVAWSAISDEAAMRAARILIAAAREARLSKLRPCESCGRPTAPESMSDDLCRDCAERQREVVH
jgi:hypothetical protein